MHFLISREAKVEDLFPRDTLLILMFDRQEIMDIFQWYVYKVTNQQNPRIDWKG